MLDPPSCVNPGLQLNSAALPALNLGIISAGLRAVLSINPGSLHAETYFVSQFKLENSGKTSKFHRHSQIR